LFLCKFNNNNLEVELYHGTTASETLFAVKFNSTANPNVEFEFPEGVEVDNTETIYVECTNLENQASPASDFDGYATMFKETSS